MGDGFTEYLPWLRSGKRIASPELGSFRARAIWVRFALARIGFVSRWRELASFRVPPSSAVTELSKNRIDAILSS
jgi:hypothetical protein